MSFTALHIPEFPIAAWLYSEPALKAYPLIVLRGAPPQEVVASLNSIAQAAGAVHGMSKVQAETACPAIFRSRMPEQERAAFQQVFETAGRFSPRVQVIAGPENEYGGHAHLAASLLIDSSGTGSLFGTAKQYAERLSHALASTGFRGGIATAPNAEAAFMLARSTTGILCAEPGSLRTCLASLPATSLPCSNTTHALLARWGIRTLGELAALPETALISRLGQVAQRLQQLARGEAPHLLNPKEPEFSLAGSLELDTPLDDLERLLFALSRLLGDILHKAVENALAVRSLTVSLTLEGGLTHAVRVAPAHPTQNRDALLKLLHLELQAHPPQAEIVAVRLEADPAQPQAAQRGLFQSQFPDPDKLDLLMARLRAIVGEENVGSPRPDNSHRMDAFTLDAFRPELIDGQPNEAPQNFKIRKALRVLRPPDRVRVSLANEQPAFFYWRGERFTITEAAGPWHASGSWWDRENFECDYWDVVTQSPAYMLRLEQERSSQLWSVVGLYD